MTHGEVEFAVMVEISHSDRYWVKKHGGRTPRFELGQSVEAQKAPHNADTATRPVAPPRRIMGNHPYLATGRSPKCRASRLATLGRTFGVESQQVRMMFIGAIPTPCDFPYSTFLANRQLVPKPLKNMVRPERFELPTFWFVARRSIQLS